jgi:hypothetical protein
MKRRFLLPFVISILHIPIFFFSIHEPLKKKPPPQKMIVNTLTLFQPPPSTAENKQSPKQTPKDIEKKTAPPLHKKALKKQLQKSIATSKSSAKGSPKKIKKIVKKDAGNTEREYNDYLQRIFEILSDSLTLPEKGKVKLNLTVGCNGKVVRIETLSSESSLNLTYLQQNVGSLIFPKYTKNENRTFTILFSDEK